MSDKKHDCLYCEYEGWEINPLYDKKTAYCYYYDAFISQTSYGEPPRRNMGFCRGFDVATSMVDKWNQRNGVSYLDSSKRFVTIDFTGTWFLVDSRVDIYVNGIFYTSESIKKGFTIKIEFDSSELEIKLKLGGIRVTKYRLCGLNTLKNYTMYISHNRITGKFNNSFKLIEA